MHTLFMSHNAEAVYHFSNLFKLPADTYGMDICSLHENWFTIDTVLVVSFICHLNVIMTTFNSSDTNVFQKCYKVLFFISNSLLLLSSSLWKKPLWHCSINQQNRNSKKFTLLDDAEVARLKTLTQNYIRKFLQPCIVRTTEVQTMYNWNNHSKQLHNH